MGLFHMKYGIIPACDVDNLDELEELVIDTCKLEFIVGYKIGMELVWDYGGSSVISVIRRHSSLPIIYDHQKFGTDIPDIHGGRILSKFKRDKVDALIIFPESGIETLKAVVKGCKEMQILPIVGGEMTHKGYLTIEGGYISDESPERMYMDAATLGVEHFVIPGTRITSMEKYKKMLINIGIQPSLLFPGIGRGQGGDILEAFLASSPCPSYAIVGRGIYAQSDKKLASINLWNTVRSKLPELMKSVDG